MPLQYHFDVVVERDEEGYHVAQLGKRQGGRILGACHMVPPDRFLCDSHLPTPKSTACSKCEAHGVRVAERSSWDSTLFQ